MRKELRKALRTGELKGHDCVDLGLPSGILWATCNVGANAPEEFGDYFCWHAESAAWGNGWITPNDDQWDELLRNTTNKWTTLNGVEGRLFTAKNGQTLFLPAAGYQSDDEFCDTGYTGLYWTRSMAEDGDLFALEFNSKDCEISFCGSNPDQYYSVRPVHEI